MRMDKAHWPGCLLWHGWLPMLSGVNGASPWAVDASESAAYLLEVALGRYSCGLISEWIPSDDFDRDMAASSFDSGDLTLSVFLRSRVMLMMAWFFMVRFVGRISWVMTLLMRLLSLDVGGSVLLSLMLVVTYLEFVVVGTLSFLTFIVFHCYFSCCGQS